MMVLVKGLLVYYFMWVVSSKIMFTWKFLYSSMTKLSVNSMLIIVLLMVVFILNLLGLVYSNMLSMMYGLVGLFGFGLWMWGLVNLLMGVSLKSYISHFCVENIPLTLSVVLPSLEVFSVIIRPLTLSIRLATNITSGHVLLTMFFLFMSSVKGLSLILFLPLLWILEMCVAVLQAFIFSTLVEMYQS